MHVVLLGLDVERPAMVTKLLLVPVLLALVVVRKAPRIIWLWLVGCWIGDLFLLWPSTFALGMAGFALAHACLIGYFLTRGAWARLKAHPWVPAAIALLAVVVMPFVFSGVDDVQLRLGMPIYSVLLVAMAALAWSFNRTAGVGAVCFVISDSLIALGFAGRISERPAIAVVEMMLYLVAIALLALGASRAPTEHSTMGAAGGRNAGDSPDRRESSGPLRTWPDPAEVQP